MRLDYIYIYIYTKLPFTHSILSWSKEDQNLMVNSKTQTKQKKKKYPFYMHYKIVVTKRLYTTIAHKPYVPKE